MVIIDQAQRRAIIDAEKESSQRTESIIYRGRLESFPVVRIPIDLPIYRMRNGRTKVEQFGYIQDQGLSPDIFENGQEDNSVQAIQHGILVNLAKDTKGPIYQELVHVGIQTNSLLITSYGVVVNGNRRLAAMREIYYRDSQNYSGFSHVDAIVLPSEAIEPDLEEIETELQLAPETKLDYGWIERRLKLRYQVESLRIPRDTIKKRWRFRREEEINTEIQQLALAEEYLDKLGKSLAYREISKSEQLFKELQRSLSGKSGDEAEIRSLAGFLLVKESGDLGDRAYGFKDIFGKEFESVMQRFADEEGIELAVELTTEESDIDEDDVLNGLDIEALSSYAPLKEALDDFSNSKELTEKLINILESVKKEKKDDNSRQQGLKKIQEALRLLTDVDISECDPETLPQIHGQLRSIISTASGLLSQIPNS